MNRDHPQKVTYWQATPNAKGGFDFTSPVILDGRWEIKQELFRTLRGDEVSSNAVVYIAADVQEGGYLFLGSSTVDDPTKVSGAEQIKKFVKVPDLRINTYERKALL